MKQRPHTLATLAVRGGRTPDPTSGAILQPIVQSTTYVQAEIGVHKGFTYSRSHNPTVSAFERAFAALEDARECVAFSTGMSAVTALCLATLRAGDRVVCSEVVYGGTYRLLRRVLAPLGIESEFVDATAPAAVDAALRRPARLVLIETPGNPTLRLADVGAIARLARAAGARLAVDNTFLTPVGQRVLELGADAAVYSTTKYVEGHNATVGGAVTTSDAALADELRFVRNTTGTIQSPLEAWLTLRGLATLPLRLEQHARNALYVARALERLPQVARVLYPGLDSFPQARLARLQQAHGGGLVSFELRGDVGAARAFVRALRLCSLAENLGAVETLITHPATMTHASLSQSERERVGITDGLLRLSVGLESPVDIVADIEQALASIEVGAA